MCVVIDQPRHDAVQTVEQHAQKRDRRVTVHVHMNRGDLIDGDAAVKPDRQRRSFATDPTDRHNGQRVARSAIIDYGAQCDVHVARLKIGQQAGGHVVANREVFTRTVQPVDQGFGVQIAYASDAS